MKLKSYLVGLSLLTGATSVHADYIVDLGLEFGAGTGEYSYDSFPDIDVDTDYIEINGKVYFGRVATKNTPIREAGFLSKQSSVFFSYSDSEAEYSASGFPNEKSEYNSKLLAANFIIPGPELILGIYLGDAEVEDSTKDDVRGIRIGSYIGAKAAIALTYLVTESEYVDDVPSEIDDQKHLALQYKQVNSIGSRSFLNFEITAIRYDEGDYDDTTLGGDITWYPNKKFGVGTSLEVTVGSGDNYDEVSSTFSPYIIFDFNDNVGIYAELQSTSATTEYDDEDVEYTFIGLNTGVNVRF